MSFVERGESVVKVSSGNDRLRLIALDDYVELLRRIAGAAKNYLRTKDLEAFSEVADEMEELNNGLRWRLN